MNKIDAQRILQLLNFLKDSTNQWENLKTYFNNTFPKEPSSVYKDYTEFITSHGLAKPMKENENYFFRIAQKGKSINLKEIQNLIEGDKGKKHLKDTRPFLYQIITALIAATFSLIVGITLWLIDNRAKLQQQKELLQKVQDVNQRVDSLNKILPYLKKTDSLKKSALYIKRW